MKKIGQLFEGSLKKTFEETVIKKSRATERGDLLKYFSEKLKKPIPRVAHALTGMDLQTLYYIKSDCDQAERKGIPWGAAFWTSIKPKK